MIELLLSGPIVFIVAGLGLAAFALFSYKRPSAAAFGIILFVPLYLVRVREDWFRINALDLLLAVFIAVALFRFVARRSLPQLPWWIAPAALIVLGASLATIFAAPQLQLRALGELKSIFVLPVLFGAVLYNIVRSDASKKLFFLRAIVVSALALAALALFGAVFIDSFITYDLRLRGFFLSPNHLAMALAPALVVVLGLLFSEILRRAQDPERRRGTNKKASPVLGGALAVIAAALFFTQSLGGIISAAFGVLLLALLFRKVSPKTAAALIAVTAVIALTAFTAMDIGSRSPFASRFMVWQASVEILKDHWVWGIGPGAFQHHYLAVQPNFPPYLEWAAPQPHNLLLAAWLSAGLLGVVGFLGLVLGITKRSASSKLSADKALFALHNRPSSNYYLLSTTTAALAAVVLHGLIDTPVLKNDLALVFWLLLAIM